MFQLIKHIYVKFQFSSFYPDELRNFLTFFQEKFNYFLRKFQNFPILKKVSNKKLMNPKRHISSKFKASDNNNKNLLLMSQSFQIALAS
jgi:hypothetical protein